MRSARRVLFAALLATSCAAPRLQHSPSSQSGPGADATAGQTNSQDDSSPSDPPLNSVVKWLEENQVEIRGSTSKQNVLQQEPARLQIRDSSGEGNTEAALDLGITWNYWEIRDLTIAPTVEYHKNTTPGKEQDTFQGGVAFRYFSGDIFEDRFVLLYQLETKYKRDEVTGSDGAIAKLTFNPLVADWMLLPTPALGTKKPRAGSPGPLYNDRRYNLTPTIGAVLEHADSVGGTPESGDVGRGLATLDGTWFVSPRQLQDRWDVHGTIRYWTDFEKSGGFDSTKDDHNFGRVGTAYYFDEDKRIGLSLDYVNGEDPELNLLEQEYIQLSFTAKI